MVGMSVGRWLRDSLPTPMPMAPDDTRITSCPAFFTSLSTLHSASTRRMFMCPVGWARVDVPTLTTIRMEIASCAPCGADALPVL